MDEIEFRELLADMLLDDENGAQVRHVENYRDAGLMTSAEGLVINMEDGREFQLTIVRSR
jgi:hypothetical protein